MPCLLFGDHTGNTRSHHSLQLSQVRKHHRPQIEKAFSSSVRQCETNLSQFFRFPRSSTKILQTVSLLISSFFSIIRRGIRSCQVLERLLVSAEFLIPEIFKAVPKSCMPFTNPRTRESIVVISIFYQLENFSSCSVHLETKLSSRSSLYHYELSRGSARYRILNTTEHGRREGSD
jgi:hypothetical protein